MINNWDEIKIVYRKIYSFKYLYIFKRFKVNNVSTLK